jgi:hypothetical protein
VGVINGYKFTLRIRQNVERRLRDSTRARARAQAHARTHEANSIEVKCFVFTSVLK